MAVDDDVEPPDAFDYVAGKILAVLLAAAPKAKKSAQKKGSKKKKAADSGAAAGTSAAPSSKVELSPEARTALSNTSRFINSRYARAAGGSDRK